MPGSALTGSLDRHSSATLDFTALCSELFRRIFREGAEYRATGVVLAGIVSQHPRFLVGQTPAWEIGDEAFFSKVVPVPGAEVLVTADGCERLTTTPKELLVVG